LSKARLLFIARYPERFLLNASLLSFAVKVTNKATLLFGMALGKHFFSMDFQNADYLSAVSNKHFIAD